ncbi:polyphosphate polymerase domain-containing protein [Nocardioides sp. Kera G14]|uniref:polyphosphate polymerase domain-containing protein n=1 Tax=Nocardioides sp. Kera G14 TaxID=2884264 RepID=UPI001D10B887|nr:polyphosphate polymerase domain-containing protein [Nocardioides sp. Kera G14]UDY24049.1 polyphosphate polymerase domain-containing protein [Nocardioides sp. Kera G14]
MTALTADRLPDLAPITLDELVAEAELLARVDRKYIVPCAEAWDALADVRQEARILEIDGRREFGYHSTYLDTPALTSFLSSGRAQRGRWKVRTRSYLDTGGSWLEVKTGGPRGQNVKQRIEAPEDGTLTAEGLGFLAGIIGGGAADDLLPVLVTTYRRTTLLLPRSGARVTVDADLRWQSLAHGGGLDLPGRVVIETKTGSTPSEVDRLLWSRGHRPVRISKYGAGMAALHPDLPHLKWHRVMQQHLLPTSLTSRPSEGHSR